MQGAWRCRVGARPSWPGVNIPWLGEMASLTGNFCLSVAAPTIVQTDKFLR